MKTKICNKCKLNKDIIYFSKFAKSRDGLKSQCKECDKQYYIINYNKNKQDRLNYAKEYRKNNKDLIKQKQKDRYIKNKDKYLQDQKEYYLNNKERIIQRTNEWRIKNRDKYINNRRKRKKERYYSDPIFRLKSNILSRINISLKHNRKSLKTEILIGCSISELKIYLESKFIDGMSWNNRELWHIDHIIPCDSFDLSNPDQQKECFHYTNLQPLWKKDNLKKSNKLEWKSE